MNNVNAYHTRLKFYANLQLNKYQLQLHTQLINSNLKCLTYFNLNIVGFRTNSSLDKTKYSANVKQKQSFYLQKKGSVRALEYIFKDYSKY